MSGIVEELPDDYDEASLGNENSSSGLIPPSSSIPDVPRHPDADDVRSYSVEEIVKNLGKLPLFMTSLDEADSEGPENIQLEALRALQYEGTPMENASNFKEQGNEMVRSKQWSDAKEFYSKGIAVLSKGLGSEAPKGDEDRLAERKVEEACYANRALCNLELKNYRSTTLDCAAALRLNPRNLKAYYRSAKALLALDKIKEAIDTCMHGLQIDESNRSLVSVMEQAVGRGRTLSTLEQKRHGERDNRERQRLALHQALQQRGIRNRTSEKPPDLEDAHMKLDPDPFSAKSTLYIPVLFLYPMHAQSDFIKAFSETDTIKQHLEYLLPVPWDEAHEYQVKSVELYTESAGGGLSKIGKDLTLLEVVQKGHAPVVDGIVTIQIVPKQQAARYIAELKKRKGR